MKVNIEDLSSVKRQVTVEVSASKVNRTLDILYQRLKHQAKIHGFRPGKVPRFILEKYYRGQVIAETAQSLIQEAYPEVLEESKLDPVAQPVFDFFDAPTAGISFVFKIIMDVKPIFELDSTLYKGLKLNKPKLKVTDEEVIYHLNALRDRQATLTPLKEDRSAKIGDVVVADCITYIGQGQIQPDKMTENLEVELGKGLVQKEIELALVKSKLGDQMQVKVDYDKDFPDKQVRGQQVRFELIVKAIKRKILPELNDNFARMVSPEFETLQALKDRITADLIDSYEQLKDQALRPQILDQLRELGQFDMPLSLVKAEVKNIKEDFKNRLRYNGMDPSQDDLDSDKLNEKFQTNAEKKIRSGIVLSRIAELEKVNVNQTDLDAELARLAIRMKQQTEVIRNLYIKNNMMSVLSAYLLEKKTLQIVKANAIIEEINPLELAKKTKGKG